MTGKNILIVDDELHITQLLSFKLRKCGASVTTANNGCDAYDLACREHPELILSDFLMPILNGFDLAVKLRENADTASIPLLLLTARGHKLTPGELARTNICEVIAKPFSVRELLVRISEFVGLSDDDARGQGGPTPGVAVA